jgi:hypothetical protein
VTEIRKFYGKYRGLVLSTADPKNEGRLIAQVLDVAGLGPTTWARPCVPFAGKQMGFWAMPQLGAGVWIEFEGGNSNHPIWSGCWYHTAAEVPAIALTAKPLVSNVVVQTQAQHTLMLSDMPGATGGILLKTPTGAFIAINDTGITLSNGKGAVITMTGSSILLNGNPVDLNGGALTVT